MYNTALDIFSFGHLMLFSILEEFPGDLCPVRYNDPLIGDLRARNEVERREKYILRLFDKLTKEHPITRMTIFSVSTMIQIVGEFMQY